MIKENLRFKIQNLKFEFLDAGFAGFLFGVSFS